MNTRDYSLRRSDIKRSFVNTTKEFEHWSTVNEFSSIVNVFVCY